FCRNDICRRDDHADKQDLDYAIKKCGGIGHANTSMMMTRVEKKNAIIKRLGNRKNRIFAMDDSKSPMTSERRAPFAAKRQSATATEAKESVVANPHGTMISIKSAIRSVCFMAAESSMRARFFPDISRIIPSWIMVSSRCVSGLSTGMREVSTIRIMKSEMPSRIRVGVMAVPAAAATETMSKMLRDLKTKASAAKTIIVVGSMTADMLISRELPMPPNALPASRPHTAMKNRASTRRYRKRMMFPMPPDGSVTNTRGTKREATRMAAIHIHGVILMIHDVFGE